MRIDEYFKDSELTCKCGCGAMPSYYATERLYVLRVLYDNKIIVRSAARCLIHNKSVGGKDTSQHITEGNREGIAFDIKVPPADEIKVIRLALYVGFTGVGVKNNDFMHIDRREVPAFWTY